jgi:hypothetical protein
VGLSRNCNEVKGGRPWVGTHPDLMEAGFTYACLKTPLVLPPKTPKSNATIV